MIQNSELPHEQAHGLIANTLRLVSHLVKERHTDLGGRIMKMGAFELVKEALSIKDSRPAVSLN